MTETVATMRALAAESLGSIDNLHMIEVSRPEPRAGEVRVAVKVAAVNPADVKGVTTGLRILHARRFPLILGYDFSGEVDALGKGVEGLRVGDEVFGFVPYSPFTRWGSFAEHTVTKAKALARKPAAVTHERAAAAATVGVTAAQVLRKAPGCGPGTRVLVTGASGGVGSLAIGIVRAMGGQADAITSGPQCEFARGLGAVEVFDRSTSGWQAALRGPYQHVLDAAAAFSYDDFRSVIPRGGAFTTALPSPSFVLAMLRARLSGRRCHAAAVRAIAADLEQLAGWLLAGLQVPIAARFPLHEGAKALALLARGSVRGKIVLDVAG